MATVLLFPTAGLPGMPLFGTISQVASLLERPRETMVERLEREKRLVRGAKMDPANDFIFEPAPGAA